MKTFLYHYFPIAFCIAVLADTAIAKTPALVYTSSGSCLASVAGFSSSLKPLNAGVSWRITFNAVGSVDDDGNVTEVGQSVDSASFGAGPRMHVPAASAYKGTFTSVTAANADGSSTFHAGLMSGTFTAGPNSGMNFTVSELELRGWVGNNGVRIYGSSGSPTIQTVSLSNGIQFQRICTMFTVSTFAPQ